MTSKISTIRITATTSPKLPCRLITSPLFPPHVVYIVYIQTKELTIKKMFPWLTEVKSSEVNRLSAINPTVEKCYCFVIVMLFCSILYNLSQMGFHIKVIVTFFLLLLLLLLLLVVLVFPLPFPPSISLHLSISSIPFCMKCVSVQYILVCVCLCVYINKM